VNVNQIIQKHLLDNKDKEFWRTLWEGCMGRNHIHTNERRARLMGYVEAKMYTHENSIVQDFFEYVFSHIDWHNLADTYYPNKKPTVGRITFKYTPTGRKGVGVQMWRSNGTMREYPYKDKYFVWVNKILPHNVGCTTQRFPDRLVITKD
jgi:hypothetical protein